MNVVKKYWDSVYVYILLLIPIFCICAGMFWTVFKFMGHYPHLKWLPVIIFDCNQIIYLLISLYFIYKTKKNSDYIYKNLKYVKCFMTIVLFVQYNFILHLFASEHVWECTFLFFAGIVFFFDTKFTIINLLSYYFSLLAAHLRNPEAFLPTGTSNFIEIIAFRITILTLTTICIIVIVYFAEHFLMQANEKDEENLQLLAKQLDYYKDMDYWILRFANSGMILIITFSVWNTYFPVEKQMNSVTILKIYKKQALPDKAYIFPETK